MERNNHKYNKHLVDMDKIQQELAQVMERAKAPTAEAPAGSDDEMSYFSQP